MSEATAAPLRTLAFGELNGGPWGFVWSDADTSVALIGGLGELAVDPTPRPVELTTDGEQWTLSGDGLALSAGDAHGQLCQLTGTLTVGSDEHQIETIGLRVTVPSPDLAALDSLRVVQAWFPPQDAVAVMALRPRGNSGHEQDAVVATVVESAGVVSIDDARLSTTYAAGAPTRMSLELWSDAEEPSYPRRAAGEVIGAGVDAGVGGLALELRPLHSHRAGRDGLGIYVLARPT